MFGFDLPWWAILLIIVAAIAVITLLLKGLMNMLQNAMSGSGPNPPPPPAPPPYQQPLQDLQAILQKLQNEGRRPTSDECAEMRRLLQKAKDNGAPAATTDPLGTAIGQLCPG